MAKAKARVGAGIPGFGESKGSVSRIWEGGEFALQIDEVTSKDRLNEDKELVGYNVRVATTCLGGPAQEDDTNPKGKKINLFINVDFSRSFTIDQLMDLFIAAGVRTSGDEPPFAKLSGKKAIAKLGKRHADNGLDYQSCYWIAPGKSKSFSSKGLASDDDD